MTVDPASSQAVTDVHEIVSPISTRPLQLEPTPQPSPQPEANPLAGIEKQFAGLIRELTQQLGALEKQLAGALGQLASGKPASVAAANDPGCCESPSRPYPQYQRFGKIITDAARRHEVDPMLVGAVIRHESGFSPTAVSRTGAKGLMQLMPDTARSLGVTDAFDPRQNVEGGTTLLRQLLDRYGGQVDLALAAYNAGTGAVDRYGGIPPFQETQAYVRNVMDTYRESALSS